MERIGVRHGILLSIKLRILNLLSALFKPNFNEFGQKLAKLAVGVISTGVVGWAGG